LNSRSVASGLYERSLRVVEVLELLGLEMQAPAHRAVGGSRAGGDASDAGDGSDVNREIPRALILSISTTTRTAKEAARALESGSDSDDLRN